MTTGLTHRRCVPCEAGTSPMPLDEADRLMEQVPGWKLDHEAPKLTRRFKFKDFRQAMEFVNKVAALAEDEGHHPDIHVSWNRVRLELTTYAIKGLSENDFILAAKISELDDGR